jgi:hypothetical protein
VLVSQINIIIISLISFSSESFITDNNPFNIIIIFILISFSPPGMSFARYGEFRLQKEVHYARIFNNFQERDYVSVIIFMKSLSGLRIFFYSNIGTEFFFMRRLIFRRYFSKI